MVALLAALPPGFRFVAKRELIRAPLVGRVIRKVGHLTVERGQASRSVADAEQMTRALRNGQSVLVVGASIRPAGEGWPAMIRLRDRARAEVVRRSGEPPVDRHPTPATRAGDPDDR